MKFKRVGDGGEFEIDILSVEGSTVRARIDGRELTVSFEPTADGGALIAFDGRRYRVFGAALRDRILVSAGPVGFEFQRVEEGRSQAARGLATPEVTAPMPGKVLRILVSEGEEVEAGGGLLVLEAMKTVFRLTAPADAVVAAIACRPGETVEEGQVLVSFAEEAAAA